MATTTPNFGWPVPTSTDLVKNGATAIEALGDAIDASMVDLEGGTTGQVLAKASNTDMDFAWVTTDDANAIQNAIVNAKGDIIGASANDVPAITSVGNNGEALVADSTTATGLRYNPTMAAGKNYCINGAFDIWQRGTTFTNPGGGSGTYTADRWTVFFNGNGTITQETTIKPDTSTYALKVTATASSAGNDVYQLVEQLNMEQFRGKIVTLSVKVAGTATLTPNIALAYSTTADTALTATNTTITAAVVANPTINASTFVTYISQFTVPTTAKTLRIGFISGTMANTNVLYWSEAQLELGSVATVFSRAGGNIQGELAACQRYYYKAISSAAGTALSTASPASTTTVVDCLLPVPVTMRTTPTVVDTSNVSVTDSVTNYSTGTWAISAALYGTQIMPIRYTHGSAVLTQFRPYFVQATSSSGYLGLSAEL
jgi:hypothetical protein